MRYLFISILLIFSSCKVTTVKDFTQLALPSEIISNPYFSSSTRDYVYKVNINLYGVSLSGILVIKKIDKTNHRMVFTSQFGSTFFDIEFNEDGHVIHTIVKELDRKIIINTLINDLTLLVREKDTSLRIFLSSDYKVLMSSKDKRNNYYFYKRQGTELQKIVHTSKTREKFEICFDTVNSKGVAQKISIDHKNIKLSIEFIILK